MKKTKVDIGYAGKTKKIDIRIVEDLISSGYISVIAPIGVGIARLTLSTADFLTQSFWNCSLPPVLVRRLNKFLKL